MEDLIASLEEQLQAQARPVSPSTLARRATSALEIDNETLREQVQHLQKRIGQLEDMLEDARVAAEREEQAGRDRLTQYKEQEDAVRQDLEASRKEVERLAKLEENARTRVAEIDEALRENTVALENARAEIEGLRAEIAVSLNIGIRLDLSLKTVRRISKVMLLAQITLSNRHIVHPVSLTVCTPSAIVTHDFLMTATGDYELLKAEKVEVSPLLYIRYIS